MKYKIAVIAVVVASLGLAAWLLGPPRAETPPASAPVIGTPRATDAAAPQVSRTAPAASATALVNLLERATDLRSVYARFHGSADPHQRNLAYRAWSACFPTMIGAEGQSASLDSVTRGISADAADHAGRVDAYRALMGRCKGFSDLPRAQLLAETERQKAAVASGEALAPGELAARYLTQGNAQRALATARALFATRDAATIDSLREFVNQYSAQQVDAQRAAPGDRPDLRALAFALAACQMGLECGAGALTALQLCASSGACSGGVAERLMQSLADADRERVAQEATTVMQAAAAGDFDGVGL